MTHLKKLAALLLFAAITLNIGCSDDKKDDGGINPPPTDRRVELVGNITGTRTLSKDTVYLLKGFVNIQQEATLIIPAGTRIEGDFETQGALLTVRGAGVLGQASYRRSGRVIANGTAQEPIVFTSERPVGQRRRGDWGGIVLNGLGVNNGPGAGTSAGGTLIGEGNTGAHGGVVPGDTSGTLRYVRLEFGGTKITPDNEINGFTFNSVGNGTVLEYLQAHYIADDAFEWFGGNVNCKYLVATGCDDDNFDMDNGYNGKIQFCVVVQDRGLANRGYEVNNDGQGTPNRAIGNPSDPNRVNTLTSPIVYNVTMVGAGVARANDDNNDGIYMRGNSQGQYWNQIVVNFGGFGAVVDGSGSITQYQNDSLQVRNSIFANRGLLGLGNPAGSGVGPGVWGAFRRSGATGYDTVDATTGLNFFVKALGRNNRNFTSRDSIRLRNVKSAPCVSKSPSMRVPAVTFEHRVVARLVKFDKP